MVRALNTSAATHGTDSLSKASSSTSLPTADSTAAQLSPSFVLDRTLSETATTDGSLSHGSLSPMFLPSAALRDTNARFRDTVTQDMFDLPPLRAPRLDDTLSADTARLVKSKSTESFPAAAAATTTSCVLVSMVDEGGPGEAAGLCVGDVVQTINGRDVAGLTTDRIAALIAQAGPELTLEVR